MSECQLVAHNDGDDNLLELEVELILPSDADAAGYADDIRSNERLPDRPRAWGSTSFGDLLRPVSIQPPVRRGLAVRAVGDEVRVKLPKVEVRPRNRTEPQPVTILLPVIAGRAELDVLWRATARDMRGVAQGAFVVPIEGEVVLAQLLARNEEDEEPPP